MVLIGTTASWEKGFIGCLLMNTAFIPGDVLLEFDLSRRLVMSNIYGIALISEAIY